MQIIRDYSLFLHKFCICIVYMYYVHIIGKLPDDVKVKA